MFVRPSPTPGGTRWSSWLRHCVTSRKVAGSIPNHLTQPLTEGIFPGGKGGRCLGITTLPSSLADCLEVWEPQPPQHSRPVHACTGIAALLSPTPHN
jgi:hypothetical protein